MSDFEADLKCYIIASSANSFLRFQDSQASFLTCKLLEAVYT